MEVLLVVVVVVVWGGQVWLWPEFIVLAVDSPAPGHPTTLLPAQPHLPPPMCAPPPTARRGNTSLAALRARSIIIIIISSSSSKGYPVLPTVVMS